MQDFERYGCGVSNSFERLQRILKRDNVKMPLDLENILKKDLINAVSNYLKIDKNSCQFVIEKNDNGKICVYFGVEGDKFVVQKNA